jgi:hypothetical protein
MKLEEIKKYIDKENLNRPCRRREVTYRRFYLYNLLRKKHKLGLKEIGRMFNQNHATVVNGLNVHTDYWLNDDLYMDLVGDVRNNFPIEQGRITIKLNVGEMELFDYYRNLVQSYSYEDALKQLAINAGKNAKVKTLETQKQVKEELI